MKIELEIKNLENIGKITPEIKNHIEEIFGALIVSGGLTGVKNGRTILHFDGSGVFQGVELDYWPYRRRKKEF